MASRNPNSFGTEATTVIDDMALGARILRLHNRSWEGSMTQGRNAAWPDSNSQTERRLVTQHPPSPTSSLRARFFDGRASRRSVTHWNYWTGIAQVALSAKIVTKRYVFFT